MEGGREEREATGTRGRSERPPYRVTWALTAWAAVPVVCSADSIAKYLPSIYFYVYWTYIVVTRLAIVSFRPCVSRSVGVELLLDYKRLRWAWIYYDSLIYTLSIEPVLRPMEPRRIARRFQSSYRHIG